MELRVSAVFSAPSRSFSVCTLHRSRSSRVTVISSCAAGSGWVTDPHTGHGSPSMSEAASVPARPFRYRICIASYSCTCFFSPDAARRYSFSVSPIFALRASYSTDFASPSAFFRISERHSCSFGPQESRSAAVFRRVSRFSSSSAMTASPRTIRFFSLSLRSSHSVRSARA